MLALLIVYKTSQGLHTLAIVICDNHGMKILIVDDSKSWRDSCVCYLKAKTPRQHDYLEASTVNGALYLLAKHDVELVLTDWEMPDQNGDALLDHLILKSWTKPVFIISSSLNIPMGSYQRENFHFFEKSDFPLLASQILKLL